MSFYIADFGYRSANSPGSRDRVLPAEAAELLCIPTCSLLAEVQQLRGQRCEALGAQISKQDRPRLVRALEGNRGSPGSPSLLAGAGT